MPETDPDVRYRASHQDLVETTQLPRYGADQDATAVFDKIPAEPEVGNEPPVDDEPPAAPPVSSDASGSEPTSAPLDAPWPRVDWWGRPVTPPEPDNPDPDNAVPDNAVPDSAGPGADLTAVLPAVTDESDSSITRPIPLPATDADPIAASEQATPAEPAPTKGVQVIPLRPIRTEHGYKSVYAQYTRPTIGSMFRTFSRVTGELLITFGLIVLLFAAYEVWGKGAIVDAHQNDLSRELAQDWSRSPQPDPTVSPSVRPSTPEPAEGAAIARVYVPRMHKSWVVVQGVLPKDIKLAPGHYPGTAMPGEVGNFSIAGHRLPAIFWDLDQIRNGDAIVVETSDTWYVYAATQTEIVSPHAVQVVAPVPNEPGVTPTDAMVTLTTCNPKYNNYQRLIVHGKLARSQPHDAGKPAELGA